MHAFFIQRRRPTPPHFDYLPWLHDFVVGCGDFLLAHVQEQLFGFRLLHNFEVNFIDSGIQSLEHGRLRHIMIIQRGQVLHVRRQAQRPPLGLVNFEGGLRLHWDLGHGRCLLLCLRRQPRMQVRLICHQAEPLHFFGTHRCLLL